LATPQASPNVNAKDALAFPAVQLFVAHAACALGEFELTDRDAPYVADICRRLDGLPLAIEIAASRVAAFGVRGVAASLNEGLLLLANNSRTALPRQRSMTATLDWSYALLSEAEQTVFRRLAIFPGKFTLRAAGAVASDGVYSESETIDLVAELVTKSLVVPDADSVESRFHLLDTTRNYALSKLTESEIKALQQRHVEYCHNIPLQSPKLGQAIPRKGDGLFEG
jgi:predicted ATPase